MSRMQLKLAVTTRFLDFVVQYCPLTEARLVGLGGKGVEVRVWEHAGVRASNGWLVERNHQLRQQLAARSHYQLCRSFEDLIVAFASSYEDTGCLHLDGVHLDLCGTLDSGLSDLALLLPLLTKGQGKCLAVTVYEQRRNLSLENFDNIWARSQACLGENRAQHLFQTLLQEQEWWMSLRQTTSRGLPDFFGRSDPRKGVCRELGIFWHILGLLKSRPGINIAPDRIERYAYTSRYGRAPARMRTYFFHLQPSALHSRQEKVRSLLATWLAAPLCVLSRDGTPQYSQFTHPSETPEKVVPMSASGASYDQLAKLAEVVGGDCLAQFQNLLEIATRNQEAAELLDDIRSRLNGSPGVSEPVAAVSAKTVRKARGRRARQEKKPAKHAQSDNGNTLDVQLDLLRARAKNDLKTMDKASRAACRELGLTSAKNKAHKVGGLLARTQKSHRADFVRRIVASKGEQVLTELAGLYSRIIPRGETAATTVTVAALKTEAGL